MSTWLEWREGEQVRRVPVTGRISVGRGPGNAVTIYDERLSRQHCVISPTAAGVLVDARSSQNGVIVGGRRSKRAEVPIGGTFQLGGTPFRVLTVSSAGASNFGVPPAATHAPLRRSGSTGPTVVAGGVAMALVAVIGVAAVVAMTTRHNSDGYMGPDAVTQALDARDAPALLATLGDRSPEPEVVDAVEQQLLQRPELRLEVVSSSVVSESGSLRREERTYRVTEPGQPTRLLTFDVRLERVSGQWVQASMIPIAEAPE